MRRTRSVRSAMRFPDRRSERPGASQDPQLGRKRLGGNGKWQGTVPHGECVERTVRCKTRDSFSSKESMAGDGEHLGGTPRPCRGRCTQHRSAAADHVIDDMHDPDRDLARKLIARNDAGAAAFLK